MDLIPIGAAARRLGLAASALRYYDERGLVTPHARHRGRRMYGREELRRLAFFKIANRLGLPLEAAAEILDAPGASWRSTAAAQIVALDELIAQAEGAKSFLTNAIDCPTEHPARECSAMIGALDRLVEGAGVESLGSTRVALPKVAE